MAGDSMHAGGQRHPFFMALGDRTVGPSKGRRLLRLGLAGGLSRTLRLNCTLWLSRTLCLNRHCPGWYVCGPVFQRCCGAALTALTLRGGVVFLFGFGDGFYDQKDNNNKNKQFHMRRSPLLCLNQACCLLRADAVFIIAQKREKKKRQRRILSEGGEILQNYRLLIQYEGTRYKGWQSQESTDQTIQGKLTAILERMTGERVDLQGSGRTDAGVHARGQVANVKLRDGFSEEELLTGLNRYLPEDIAVQKVEPVDLRFHSRLNAVEKTYVYRIWNSAVPDVFERRYVTQVEEPLDLEAMRQAADLLLGTHDFQSFCTKKKTKKSTVRTIREIEIRKLGPEVRLTYTGSGFLYHMVRILTGTLIEVGLHQRPAGDMPEILAACSRERAGALAPAQGLTLWNVEY